MRAKQSGIRHSGFGIRAGGLSCAVGLVCGMCVTPTRADIDPVSGIDFVTIGAVGNAAYSGSGRVNGRGRVDYQYNIGRFEVTTAQWAEFYSAVSDRDPADFIPWVFPTQNWGGVAVPGTVPGGTRYMAAAGREMAPVGDITWRTAAILCNWYHNNKATNREAFLTGAYDVSTFGVFGETNYSTDQEVHSPGARYWIPTWDEWLKAAHYDPNKQNTDGSVGGWWSRVNGTETDLIYGPPGQTRGGLPTQANAGWDQRDFPGFSPRGVLLGAYADVRSPWGLFDVAGGTTEWTEDIRKTGPGFRARTFDGSSWDSNLGISQGMDLVYGQGSNVPYLWSYPFGFRIASSVPTPGACALGILALVSCARRSRHGGKQCKLNIAGGQSRACVSRRR